MSLDRQSVEKHAGEQIRVLQQTRYVSDAEKTAIRKAHEAAARKVEVDRAKRR